VGQQDAKQVVIDVSMIFSLIIPYILFCPVRSDSQECLNTVH
jgi:hypothetical protein